MFISPLILNINKENFSIHFLTFATPGSYHRSFFSLFVGEFISSDLVSQRKIQIGFLFGRGKDFPIGKKQPPIKPSVA